MTHNPIVCHLGGVTQMGIGLRCAGRVLRFGVWLTNASMRRLRWRAGNGRWQPFTGSPPITISLDIGGVRCEPEI